MSVESEQGIEKIAAGNDGQRGGFMRAQDFEMEEEQQIRAQSSVTRRLRDNSDVENNSNVAAVDDESSSGRSSSSKTPLNQPHLELNVAVANGTGQVHDVKDDVHGSKSSRDGGSSRSSTPPPASSPLSSSDRNRQRPMRRSTPPPTPPARLTSSSSRLPLKRRSSSGPAASSSSSPPPNSRYTSTSTSSSSSPPAAKQARLSNTPSLQKEGVTRRSSSPPSSAEKLKLSVTNPSNQSSSSSPSSSSDTLNQTTRNLTSSPASPPLSSLSSPPPSTSVQQQQAHANGASASPVSSPSSSSSSSSSSSPLRPQTPVRRVKVYALYDSNWIDLGTGACTYHRGIAHRIHRRIVKSVSESHPKQEKDANNPSPPLSPNLSGISIAGRSARESSKWSDGEDAMTDAEEEHSSEDVEEQVELIELDAENLSTRTVGDESQDDDDMEEAAWIEVLKEGRWKTDMSSERPKSRRKKTKSKQKDEAVSSKITNGTHEEENDKKSQEQDLGSSSEGSDSDLEDEGKSTNMKDDFEKIWRTRIERPDSSTLGIEPEPYQPHSGSEEGEEVIGRYRRQQDTLIVWKSAAGETELALSFAATAGCAEVWDFLKIVHKRWEVNNLASREYEEEQDVEHAGLFYGSAGGGSSNTHHAGGGQGTGYGLGLGPIVSGQGLLPDPTLSNLAELDKTIKFVGRTQLGREKLSSLILRTVS